jgi:type II restriction enzyme
MSERWVSDNLYCPACQAERLYQLPNNQEAADFACPECREQFEVKSGARFGSKIVNGAFAALMRRMAADSNPNLVLLRSDKARMTVLDLDVIPRRFFTQLLVEPRAPLAPTARRKGWVGCNIHLDRLPSTGRIPVIADRHIRPEKDVRADWAGLMPLLGPLLDERAWLATILRLVEASGPGEFNLASIYRHESTLQHLFPNNRNIRPKVRQQLQKLRDAGLLVFLGSGKYRLTRPVQPQASPAR